MQDFWIYFEVGFKHIADFEGYDHILFIAALCVRYLVQDWKKVLILVTAFTIGHSITLALSVLNYINVPTNLIEFLIPVTIMITALSNIFQKTTENRSRLPLVYFYALFFGLIHGLGFSNFLKSMLGKEESIIGELLAFNVGLEIGQIAIVIAVMLLAWLVVSLIKVPRRAYVVFISLGIFAVALKLAIERFPS
jgi:ABC-type antimicrobial peptide transport system permease subunit